MPDNIIEVQLFLPDSGSYSEAKSQRVDVRIGEWQQLEFRIPSDASEGRFRLDPGDLVAVVEIPEIVISASNGEEPLWSLCHCSEDDYELDVRSFQIPSQTGLTIISYGSDPQIVLPVVPCGSTELSIRVLIRIRPGMPALRGELLELHTRFRQMEEEIQFERLQVDLLRGDLNAAKSEYAEATGIARVREERDRAIQLRDALLKSWSWRLSLPIRLVGGLLRQTISVAKGRRGTMRSPVVRNASTAGK